MKEKPFQPLENFTEGSQGGFSNIEQVKQNPDVLVKELAFLSSNPMGRYTFEDFTREVMHPIDRLKKLGFGKFIPPVMPVWGKNESGAEKGFIVMKKVRGADIQNMEKFDGSVAKELDELLAASFDAVSKTIGTGEEIIFPDIAISHISQGHTLSNIMVGKLEGDEKEHVYLIDLYPATAAKEYFQNVDVEKFKKEHEERIERLVLMSEGGYAYPLSRDALEALVPVLIRWKSSPGAQPTPPLSAHS